jgi:hypothetical protein
LVSCQEEYLNDEETSVDQDQHSFIPFQIFLDIVPPSQEPHSPPTRMSYTSTKQDQDIPSTIPKDIIKDQEKDNFPMLPKIPFEEKSVPSPSYSTLLHSLQNYAQALNNPVKGIAPITVTHKSIDGFGHVSHSKDANIPTHGPFTFSKSIPCPYPTKLKPSSIPSILGPYVPLSPTSTLSSLHIPPTLPQDQQRYT